MSDQPAFSIKRVYLPAATGDGRRVLVDRLWPRGLRKSEAAVDDWLKDVAPSTDLRKWFHHDPSQWDAFRQRYRAELATNPAVAQLLALAADQPVTLLFAARDEERNHALVLVDYLRSHKESPK